MIKNFLLASSLLSFTFSANAETELYVIKDGKMVNCEFVPSSSSEDKSTIIKESKNETGDDMVELINPVEKYTSGLVYLPQTVDLNQTWNLEVEYYFNKDVSFSGENVEREGLSFDLMADTVAFADTFWVRNRFQKDYRIAHVSIDCAFRDFIDIVDGDTVRNNFGVGKLRTVRKYVYSSLLLPKLVAERGDVNQVKAIFMSIFPESGVKTSCFIKNLKFVSEGTKPFFADKFVPLSAEGSIDTSVVASFVYGTYNGNAALSSQAKYSKISPYNPTEMVGQQLFLAESKGSALYSLLESDRMYCKLGEQRGADFYDSEYGFLPYVKAATEANKKVDKDGVKADAIIRIPLGYNIVYDTISIAMRLGHNAGKSGDYTPYADYKEKSKDIRFPVEYRFESGGASEISEYTEWQKFRPTYTKGGDDYVDSIPTMMSMVYGDVNLPADNSGEYSYITLRFVYNDVISYMFTDLRLTGDRNTWQVRSRDMFLQTDFAGFEIPGPPLSFNNDAENNNDVENIVAKGEISIYPNPATDVITVTNEGVKSVAVYSVAGSLVASSKSNVVNVANLVKGIYVVKANTEAGVISGQIIKK